MNRDLSRIANRVAFSIIAEEDLGHFVQEFKDLRQDAKSYKENLETKMAESLKKDVESALKKEGYEVESVDLSLGKYRGSRFVTSAKVRVKGKEKQVKGILKVLLGFSPKYVFKGVVGEDVLEFNIR